MTITVTSMVDAGGDVLQIEGCAEWAEGQRVPLRAHGWVSATTNHFDPEHYGPREGLEGLHLVDDARPREMTAEEIRRYCEGLLAAQNAALLTAPPPSPPANPSRKRRR